MGKVGHAGKPSAQPQRGVLGIGTLSREYIAREHRPGVYDAPLLIAFAAVSL